MYNGSRKWGAVRVTFKRSKFGLLIVYLFHMVVYVENHKYKKSMAKERMADKKAQVAVPDAKFAVVVKAKSPKRSISIIV